MRRVPLEPFHDGVHGDSCARHKFGETRAELVTGNARDGAAGSLWQSTIARWPVNAKEFCGLKLH